MKQIISVGLVLLFSGTNLVADELEIKLIDESYKSGMVQKKIVGCNDHLHKKELTCSKEPEEIILSKLPTSSQLDSQDFSRDEDIDKIKSQLSSILREISMLKKQRAKDRRANEKIKRQLNGLIEIISDKQSDSAEKKLKVVKKGIKKLIKNNGHKKITRTYISKAIKVIEKTDEHIIVEVQQGESLSTYAQAYYGDNTKYYKIYKANRDKIAENLQVVIGTRLVIPLK